MLMIYTGDRVTGTANTLMVCVQLRVSKGKACKSFSHPSLQTPWILFTALLKIQGPRLKTPALDFCKQDRLMSKVNAFKKYLWNAFYMPGTVLDTWDAVVNKTDKVGIFLQVFSKFIFQ